jgi:hypothetical protein
MRARWKPVAKWQIMQVKVPAFLIHHSPFLQTPRPRHLRLIVMGACSPTSARWLHRQSL